MRTIEIDGVKYELDVERAAESGFLNKTSELPLKAGDVYVDLRGKYCSMLLVAATNEESGSTYYQLLGGARTFSGAFFGRVRTLEEIKHYLLSHDMKFSHNVSIRMAGLFSKEGGVNPS